MVKNLDTGNLGFISMFAVNWIHMQNKKTRFTFPAGGGANAPLAHACGRLWWLD